MNCSMHNLFVCYFELHYTPNLHANFRASSGPRLLGFCSSLLNLAWALKQANTSDCYLSLLIRTKESKIAVLPVVFLCLYETSHSFACLPSSKHALTTQHPTRQDCEYYHQSRCGNDLMIFCSKKTTANFLPKVKTKKATRKSLNIF